MQTSNAFKATSFSFAIAAVLAFESCGSSSETASYSPKCFYYHAISRASLPEFNAALFHTPDSSGQRLDVYVSLKEARLKFEKIGDLFRARCTVNVRLLRDGEPFHSREIQRVVWRKACPSFSDSSYDASLVSFRVNPGKYTAEIFVTDEVSGETAIRKYRREIPDLSGRQSYLSDILLLGRFDTVGNGRRITPFILKNAGLLSDTLKFFTVLYSENSSSDSVFFDVFRLESHERLPSGFGGSLFSSSAVSYDPCRLGVDTCHVYSFQIPVAVQRGFTYIFGGIPRPEAGSYVLKVSTHETAGITATSLLPFLMRGRYFPDISDDLPQLVNSLRYITSPGELGKITSDNSDSAIKVNLLKFWSEGGGKVKMSDYYGRVSEANRLFSTCMDGWRTPMGMFYVVCGPPDFVECRGAFSERWMYVRSSTNERVVIDFRLTRDTDNPEDRYYGVENISSNMDFWSYYVSRWRTPY